jgi:hypothetical protein
MIEKHLPRNVPAGTISYLLSGTGGGVIEGILSKIEESKLLEVVIKVKVKKIEK